MANKMIGEPTKEELDKLRLKTSTPLQKVEDAMNIEDIISDDAKMVKVHFISELMVKHLTNQEMQKAFEEKFGEPITLNKITRYKNLTRAVYLTEISRNRDELVAEELMQCEWQLRELRDYWERSKKGLKKSTKHTAHNAGSELIAYDLDEETITNEESHGDLDAMKRIDAVRERMIKVLGLDKRIEDEGEGGKKGTGSITINIVGATRDVHVEEAEVVQ